MYSRGQSLLLLIKVRFDEDSFGQRNIVLEMLFHILSTKKEGELSSDEEDEHDGETLNHKVYSLNHIGEEKVLTKHSKS